jgi:hypothetical protein
METAMTIGLDLGKSVFQIHGVDAGGRQGASSACYWSGPVLAEGIMASGYRVPHQQAAHKTAPDHNANPSNHPLQCGSHPHRTSYRSLTAARPHN